MPNASLLDLQSVLITLSLITPRALVCLVILPGFSLRTLTGIARNGVAIAMALPAALPTYYFVQHAPPDFFMAGVLALKECAIGLLLGITMSMPVWVAQSIGSIVDAQRSPIQIQANNASLDSDASALGGMLVQAVVLVLVQSGLFLALARILIESYGIWPCFDLMPPFQPGHMEELLKRLSAFFWNIVVYGGPVLIPLMLIDFGFAIIGVFASGLQVSFASSPIKSLMGLFILLVYWPTFSHYMAADFAGMRDLAAGLLQAGGAP
jgi:type III secretion protein T